ncbi:polyubiquitin 11-like [Ipomoea triloba]|uniref:polyubiquitin 11-like n=1 Tax=Ipomoea triloba TaxID=35885 RepID=UPI00125E5A67|nr:polyubiquitin 11-like [Ipomoea triloba]
MEASCERNPNPTAQQEEEEITISVRIIKTVSAKINKSETVARLKTLLREEEGVQECLQQFFMQGGTRLEDDKRLVDYGIHGHCTLNAFVENSVPFMLSVRIPSPNKKAVIQAKENIPPNQHTLFYNGKQLEEDKTLASLGIRGHSTLHMIFNPKETLKVHVKTLTGEAVETQVRILYTILDVKTVVESKVGYPVKVLEFGGKMLEDSETIFIKWGGKSTGVEVFLWETVKNLKEAIFKKLGVPVHVQKLVFEGKTMIDSQELASYGVRKDSNIQLSAKFFMVI